MLKELYDYAVSNGLTLPPGFVKKGIKAYICISTKGEFTNIEVAENEEAIAPDMGSLANGTTKSNVLAEKCSIVLPKEKSVKSEFFREVLRDASSEFPEFALCLSAIESEQDTICEELRRSKIKDQDRITFKVGGVSILSNPKIHAWWDTYRLRFQSNAKSKDLCLITGQPTVPLATQPPINGLSIVGGRGSGDRLMCFDKSAFCSYDLVQGENAPVSEDAFSAVKAALDALLRNAPILDGMKFVHWYDKAVPEDLISTLWEDNDEDDDDDEDIEADAVLERAKADRLVRSAKSGEEAIELNSQYYILLINGASGRVMIRSFEHGSYQTLQKNIKQWNDDLRLKNAKGTGEAKRCKLTARLARLMKHQTSDKKMFERMGKELAGITPAVLMAILTGSALPDTVAARSLAYIRSRMVNVDENITSPPIPDSISCQWLKVWLLRKNRKNQKEELLMDCYNPHHPESAYHCGALVSVYAAIQHRVMPEVNAGLAQRYYSSASQNPALVLGQLARMSNHHREKITSDKYGDLYDELLNEASIAIGDVIPVTLDLEGQAYFALGYRQMSAKISKRTSEFKGENKTDKKEEEV